MLFANLHEKAVFKSLYFSIIYMFLSERKYVPIKKSTNVGLGRSEFSTLPAMDFNVI